MGAFMALPVAALITSFLTHYRKPQEVVYHSIYEDASELPDAANSGSNSGDGSEATDGIEASGSTQQSDDSPN
jgi:hypothetical protein